MIRGNDVRHHCTWVTQMHVQRKCMRDKNAWVPQMHVCSNYMCGQMHGCYTREYEDALKDICENTAFRSWFRMTLFGFISM
jgi:hypothetical protein